MDIKELAFKSPDLIEWDSEALGTLYIFWFSIAVQSAIAGKFKNLHGVDAHEFAQHLSTLICSRIQDKNSKDRITADESKQFNENDLNSFALLFIDNNKSIFNANRGSNKNHDTVIHELHIGLSNYINESSKRMKKFAEKYSGGSMLSARAEKDLARLATRASMQLANNRVAIDSASLTLRNIQLPDYTRKINELAAIRGSISSLANQSLAKNTSILNMYDEHDVLRKSIESLAVANPAASLLRSLDTNSLFRASLSSQVKLIELARIPLGSQIGATGVMTRDITDSLSSITNSYRGVIESLPSYQKKYIPFISLYAPREYANELEVVEEISIPAVPEDEPEHLSPINHELHSYDDRLPALLTGARQSLYSDNPEKARHVTTSVRELFTHVLHDLAPDKDVSDWSTAEIHYHNGRPTRRARLLYICRVISCDPLTNFVQADVKAALSFVDSLNAGTHTVQSKLTQRQLEAIVYRMESLILFLIKVSQGGE